MENRYPKQFIKANREAAQAIEDGDDEKLAHLDAGYDDWVNSRIDEIREKRHEK